MMHADFPYLIAKGPQLLQALFAAMTDLYVYKSSVLLFGVEVSRWTAVCQLSSWFNAYCLIRTYSSSVEAAFTAVGIYYFMAQGIVLPPSSTASSSRGRKKKTEQQQQQTRATKSWQWMMMAALCIAIRPSSGLFWGGASLWYLAASANTTMKLKRAVMGLFIAAIVLACTAAWDRLWYQR